MTDLEQQDTIVADAIEAEMRHRFASQSTVVHLVHRYVDWGCEHEAEVARWDTHAFATADLAHAYADAPDPNFPPSGVGVHSGHAEVDYAVIEGATPCAMDPVALREAAVACAKRARRDAEEIEASGREYREAADA